MDKNILYNTAELQTLVHANVFAFFVRIKNPNAAALASAIIDGIPTIQQIVSRKSPPHVGIINKGGAISNLQGWDALVTNIQAREKQIADSRPDPCL